MGRKLASCHAAAIRLGIGYLAVISSQRREIYAADDVEVHAESIVLIQGSAKDRGFNENLLRTPINLFDDITDTIEVLRVIGDHNHVLDRMRVAAGILRAGLNPAERRGGVR